MYFCMHFRIYACICIYLYVFVPVREGVAKSNWKRSFETNLSWFGLLSFKIHSNWPSGIQLATDVVVWNHPAMAETKEQHACMRFCFFSTGENGSRNSCYLSYSLQGCGHEQNKIMSDVQALGIVSCRFKTNHVQGVRQPPERMKASWKFMSWSWREPSPNNWRTCWCGWVSWSSSLRILSEEFWMKRITAKFVPHLLWED